MPPTKKKKIRKRKSLQKLPGKIIHALNMELLRGLVGKMTSNRDFLPAHATLDFVRGLRFSSQLIYLMRRQLANARLEVDWGHIINRSGSHLSNECDILVHRGKMYEWNGDGGGNDVMNFKFVESKNVIAVISCKSYVKSSIDKDFPKDVKKYAKKVFLFAECCPIGKFKKIRRKVLNAGYKDFWRLYDWDEKTKLHTIDHENLNDFCQKIRNLK